MSKLRRSGVQAQVRRANSMTAWLSQYQRAPLGRGFGALWAVPRPHR
jgi:hypothetical protein